MIDSSESSSTVFVSRFNRILCVIVWALCAVLAVGAVISAESASQYWFLVPLAWIGACSFVALWQPRLRVDDVSVTVRNVMRTITIPWEALIHVDTKYALALYTPGKSFSVWAAPAPGSITVLRLARRDSRSTSDRSLTTRPGDLPGTDSGDAAAMVRSRWESLKSRNLIATGIADTAPVAVRWNVATIATAVLGGGASLVALTLA
ncbi:PH domain-containing protein [Mycetocola sp. 2940]|uniref:PH domain-containing protein n=1 Tax=Mycetocola sp. 2940 TaxID=3156452 RepID=UPI00339B66A8